MAFIKVKDVVINTSYIAAVRLEGKNRAGEESVSLLVAIPMLPLFAEQTSPKNSYQYEWLEFTGSSALALQDYFSSYSNVHDLLPQPYQPLACCGNQ